MGAFLVRPATLADADALAPLLGQLGYPSPPEKVRARIARAAADPAYDAFVAEDAEGIVGLVAVQLGWPFERDGPFVRVIALVTDARARRRGVGARLMAEAERWARERGADQVHLTANLRREEAHRFYEEAGYARTGWRFVRPLE
jgi:GNAT superfamily N-acetyltransferase